MTIGTASGNCMVLDTMCLMHYALVDRLDVLGSFLVEYTAYSTSIVRDELLEKSRTRDARISNAMGLPWLEFDPLDTVEDLRRLADWKSRVAAVRVARRYGLEVHGNPVDIG